jgi:hypothetical protein
VIVLINSELFDLKAVVAAFQNKTFTDFNISSEAKNDYPSIKKAPSPLD